MSSAPGVSVELLYAGNTAAATVLKTSSAAAGWDGLGAADGERVRLAEGPLWEPHSRTLYFIDILGRSLHALRTDSGAQHSDRHRQWSLPALPGTVTLTEKVGVLLLAMQDGLYLFDTGTGQSLHTGVDCEPGMPDNRCNDGKVDPAGRLLVGTMALDESEKGRGKGGLYCVDASGGGQWQCRRLLDGLSIPNGLAWSKDGTRFFHTDTPLRQIKEYQYDCSTGAIVGEGRVAITVSDEFGYPDGLTIDDEDMLGGGRVSRFSPVTGAVLSTVSVGGGYVSRVSSCTFGGEGLTDLYITTAAPAEPFDYAVEGLAGSVFVARNVGARGTLSTPFKGALHTSQP